MASLTKRNGKWQARVRRKGFPTQTKSFTHKDDAQRWVRLTETQIETHELPKAPPCYPSFKEAIQRYSQEVSIFKKAMPQRNTAWQSLLNSNGPQNPLTRFAQAILQNSGSAELKK